MLTEPNPCCPVAVHASHLLPGQRLSVCSPDASPYDPVVMVSGDFIDHDPIGVVSDFTDHDLIVAAGGEW